MPMSSEDDAQGLDPRLRALCDLRVAEVREYAGRHEYDGVVQDLSPAGVQSGLDALDAAWQKSSPAVDAFDERLMDQASSALRLVFVDLADHRRNPVHHLGNLDV